MKKAFYAVMCLSCLFGSLGCGTLIGFTEDVSSISRSLGDILRAGRNIETTVDPNDRN